MVTRDQQFLIGTIAFDILSILLAVFKVVDPITTTIGAALITALYLKCVRWNRN